VNYKPTHTTVDQAIVPRDSLHCIQLTTSYNIHMLAKLRSQSRSYIAAALHVEVIATNCTTSDKYNGHWPL